MDPHSQPNAPDAVRVLEGQLRECFGRVVYSHKTHEKCADILLSHQATVKLWQIILSAGTTVGLLAAVFGTGRVFVVMTAVVSTVLLALNTYTKDHDLGALSQKHKQAANGLWLMRERYLSLLTDLAIGGKSIEAIQRERDALLEELHAVYTGAPATNDGGYQKAQDALKRAEDMTFSDAEIDAFLPKELRRG